MPTVIIGDNATGTDFTGTEDVKLRQQNPDDNLGNLTLGVSKWAPTDHEQTCIRFTGISNLPSAITVSGATLELFVNNSSGVSGQTWSLYRLKRAWVEGEATWNSYASGSAWQTAGALGADDIETTPSATVTGINSPFGYVVVFSGSGLDDDIEDFAGGAPNHGWLVRRDGVDEGDTSFSAITNSEGDDTQRPRLTVPYTEGGGPQELEVVPEGGIVWGGSATVIRSRVVASAGGTTWGGNADVIRSRVSAPTGGVVWGGAASTLRSRVYTPTGGTVWGGAASITRQHLITPSGGFTFGGSALVVRQAIVAGTGGVVWGGSAQALRSRVVTPTAGIVWGGAADVDTEHAGVQELHWVPSGGITWSATASVIRTRVHLPTSGFTWSGSAAVERTRQVLPSGGLEWSGSAVSARGIAVTPTGGITFSGAATVARGVSRIGEGGFTWGGAAPVVRSRTVLPSAGITWGGSATVVTSTAGQTPIDSTPGAQIGYRDPARQVRVESDRRVRRLT